MMGAWLAVRQGRLYSHVLAGDLAVLDEHLARQEEMLVSVPLLRAEETAALRRPAYAAHVALGERLGVVPESTRATRGASGDTALVLLPDGDTYSVAAARYSVPYATPDAAAALDSIGARFTAVLAAQGLPRVRVVVTSVLRSGEDQEDLRRVNSNAARGRSSHEYGVSFDLAYRRFEPVADTLLAAPGPQVPRVLRALARTRRLAHLDAHADYLATAYPARLDALLGRTLLTLKADSVLVVLRERRQPVYHVTVARRLVR